MAILLVCLVAGFRSQKIQYLLFRTISGVGGNQGRTQHVYDYDAGQEPHDQDGLRDSGEPRQVELLIDICDTSLYG